MPRLLVYVLPVALAIYALIDFSRSEPSERAGIRPLGWLAIIVLLPVIGPVTWIVVSRTQGTAGGGAKRPSGPAPRTWPARRPGPKAPDDDPDFLWRLEQQRRRGRAADGDTPPASPQASPQGDPPDDAAEGP